jgi:tetratricopeptide (TPR) repeat protein
LRHPGRRHFLNEAEKKMAGRTGIVVAVGLLGGLAGCSSQQGSVQQQQSQEPPRAASHKENDGPKHDLQPSTCIALGNTSERSAELPGRSPNDQQHLREQARRAYQQALKLDPKNLDALSSLGNLYVTLKDYPRACETFHKATELAPQKASTWYELGMCQSRMKDWQPALTALQKSVELEPENRQYVHSYGYCLARAGQYDASLAAFVRLDGQAVAHYNLGRMLLHMKEETLARQHLQQAIELDKDLVAASELLNQLGQRVTMGAPSPIIPASYEKVTPAERAVPLEELDNNKRAVPLEELDNNKENGFSSEAAAALRRVGAGSQ